MYDTHVTLQGWVGGDVTKRETNKGEVVTFRVGCTPRYFSPEKGFKDGDTSWYTVTCWRSLARNVEASVRKGEAVVVHGRLRSDVWAREDGTKSISHQIDATFVGHDLNRGTSAFLKSARADRSEHEEEPAAREVWHDMPVGGPRLDSFGNELPPPAEEENSQVA